MFEILLPFLIGTLVGYVFYDLTKETYVLIRYDEDEEEDDNDDQNYNTR